jgi:transcriptional regulator with XRE-family HTH domain
MAGIGQHLKQAREAAGLSLADMAAIGHFTRGHLNNIEAGRRVASAAVVAAYEKALAMQRRHLFQFAAVAIGSLVIAGDEAGAARDLYTTIACCDDGPLATVQTSHAVDHAIQRLAVRETKSITQLLTWLNDGSDPILRVNAAGILAKTGSPELADDVALALGRDAQMRHLYLTAVRQRVGDDGRALAAELTNPGDSGARWCAAWLLADDFRSAIIDAMRVEPSKENLRAMALATTGALRDVRD